jgi:hypothetical protein
MPRTFAAAVLLALLSPGKAVAGPPEGNVTPPAKSSDVVTISVTAEKPDRDGKQTVTVKLHVASSFYILGNPVEDEDLEDVKTSIRVYAAGKLVEATVQYPKGKLVEPGAGLKHRIYEGEVVCKVVIARTKANPGPFEIVTDLRAANAIKPLRPSRIKKDLP